MKNCLGLSLNQLRLVHQEIAAGDYVSAANMVRYALGLQPNVESQAQGKSEIWELFDELIDAGEFVGAATLCMPPQMFSAEPESVRRLFKACSQRPMVLAMSASSMGKTYSLVVFMYLEWLRDPYFTAVKLMSQTENHLRTNMWPHLIEVSKACVLKPDREIDIKPTEMWMGLKGTPQSYGFSGMAFKQSSIAAGAWAGYKTQPKRDPRDKNYKKFGPMTRLRVLMDEAQNMPEAVWTDMNSIMGSISGNRVRIVAAFNPHNVSQPAVARSEPAEGWMPDQMETLYSYESKFGWWVERLDARQCENVIAQKEIYPGLMTYERYVGYLKGGGDNSPTYTTYARGFPPLQEAANTVIPPAWVSSQRGEAVYVEHVIHVGAFDAAYQGQDAAVLAIGRWGLASGWRDSSGRLHEFYDRLDPSKKRPRHVLTIDQFFRMSKSLDPIQINQQLMGQCKMLGIEPQWMAMDMTGNALATYSYVAKYWGNVLGVGWNTASTESKILTEDMDTCNNRYEGLPSEMWFALKHWIDPSVNAVLLNPTINCPELYTQLTGRRFRYSKASRLKIESKEEFKARNAGKSPDEADCIVMLIQLLRLRGGVVPGIVEQKNNQRPKPFLKPVTPTSDSIESKEIEDLDTVGTAGRGSGGGLEV